VNEPIVHHHYHFGACASTYPTGTTPPSGPNVASQSAAQAAQHALQGGGSKFRTQFDRGSYEIMQQVNGNWYACAWVWSPTNEYSIETWIWVTDNPNSNFIYLVPGGGGSPNNLTWRVSKTGLPLNATEAEFIAWVKVRAGVDATLVGTKHTTVMAFFP
jgi:hypothetical protein